MKKALAFLIVLLLAFAVNAQTTVTNPSTVSQLTGGNHFYWNITDIDSTDDLWSSPFSLAGYEGSTTDINVTVNVGAAATSGTYDFDVFLFGCWTDPTVAAEWAIVDTVVDGLASTTLSFYSVDLDDKDEAPYYKLRATNNGGDNTARIGLYSPHAK